MVYLGNRHDSFPALVLQDPMLEPVDKIVWMVMAQAGRATGTSTAFPSYREIQRRANVASSATVSRAITILRATRWLSICARVRDSGGRFRGSVYALHDEPLPLPDAIRLDAEYMAFLETSRTHRHGRVRRIADVVLESIERDVDAGVDVTAPEPMLERRLKGAAVHAGEPVRRYFSFSADVLSTLSNRDGRVSDRQRWSRKFGQSDKWNRCLKWG